MVGPGSQLWCVIIRLEREVLVVGLVRIDPGLPLDDDALARSLDDSHFLVTRHTKVDAILDLLTLQNEIGDLVHDIASVFRIPEEDLVDGAAFQIWAGIFWQTETVHTCLVLKTGLLDSAANPDHIDGEDP